MAAAALSTSCSTAPAARQAAGVTPEPSATTPSTPPGDVPDIPISDAAGVPSPTPVEPPVEVLVPDLGIAVPIEPVGVAADGQVEVPPDALWAGWYRFGPSPGEPGAAVVVAHAGSEITPRGPFFDLTRAEPGMRVDVVLHDGAPAVFEVVDVEVIDKDGLDLAPYFARDGEPRLVLITCGGVWDEAAQSYRSNVLVTARLVDG